MCVKGGLKPDELSYEQVAALKDIKDLTVDERRARDEFSASPPDILSKAQKERWIDLLTGKLRRFLSCCWVLRFPS